jgi:hypothetical protein
MRLTTISVWQKHKEITRNATAAIKLNTKMKSFKVTSATTATALAIAKATDTIDHNQTLSANANLRISNLEKFVQKQEQKSNTIINQIKSKSLQKNFQGSHPSESVASPKKMTLTKKTKNTNLKRNLVDLTTDDTEDNGMEEITLTTIPSISTKYFIPMASNAETSGYYIKKSSSLSSMLIK